MVMVVQFGKYIKIDEVIQSNMLCKGQKMDMLLKTYCVSGKRTPPKERILINTGFQVKGVGSSWIKQGVR